MAFWCESYGLLGIGLGIGELTKDWDLATI